MPKPTKKRRVASKPKSAKKAAAQPALEEEAAFTKSLIECGEAARLDKDGKLPAGATHQIVEDEAGNVKVVRRRFSIA